MFEIKNIANGWLTLKLENNVFHASYLSDPIKDINKVLDYLNHGMYENYHNPKKVHIDGEGVDLYLTFWTDWLDNLHILWEAYETDDAPEMKLLTYDIMEFCKSWEDLCSEIKEDYIKNFLCED